MKKNNEQLKKQSFFLVVTSALLLLMVPVLQGVLTTSTERLEEHWEKSSSVLNYLEGYQAEKEKLAAIQQEIPDYHKSLKILDRIVTMGRESGVKLAAIRSEQEQQRGELGKLRLEVPVNGSYTSIRNFILAVEKSAEPVYIASIENNPQEDEPGRLSLTLVLIAVYKKGKS